MKIWKCALRGDGSESCPGLEEDEVEATIFPCLYETYPSSYNIVGGSLQVDEPAAAKFNAIASVFGVITLCVWIMAFERLKKEVRDRNGPMIAYFIYVFVVGVGSIVGSVMLQSQLNDDSDVVCRGYTSFFEEHADCAVGYTCNGDELERENNDLDVALKLVFCASAFLSLTCGAGGLMGVIMADVLQCDCFVFYPN